MPRYQGCQNQKMTWGKIYGAYISGLVLFFMNWWMLSLCHCLPMVNAALYTATLTTGYILLLMAGIWTSRHVPPQPHGRCVQHGQRELHAGDTSHGDEYSVNCRPSSCIKDANGTRWINESIRSVRPIVLGTPGSGKSYAVVNNYIKQQISKGFALYLYGAPVKVVS